ncbi:MULTISPECIES: twin-arginine translocase subunit TatC [unclassified Thioalkalivibrio]|uniref:twin-arginine translocase subunit TatC n=1 Tax=unclassified Thioalkalivibrio TaxID=2621013 RepID=UPI000195A649|nr:MULTISPECIES: twin-arginine translocase subunit TatC [unclassified Thioalkalivibrio]ADC70648.1 Sec-independent protein translocase, TatC subunit [Thioalkalivibrio sp. K90mix]
MSKTKPEVEPSPEATETLLTHLIELRDRVLRMFIAILVVFLVLFPFANPIYTWLADPLMQHLPEGTSMIAIDVAAPFLIPFKLVLLLAVVISIPYLLYQVWSFVAPGLYSHEKNMALPLVASSTILFYLGMAFAYFVVFPLIFAFFTATAPEGVSVMTDISRYLSFVIMLFIAFGIAFEVPVATILLVSLGATTPDKLAKKRPYVIVGVFLIGMVLTPPDIISQTLLALPMWLLFEIGLILSRIMERKKAEKRRAQGGDEPDDLSDDSGDGPDDPDGGPGGGGKGASGTSSRKAAAATATAGAASSSSSAGARETPASARAGYTPMTDEEMDAELDRIEAEQAELQRQKEARKSSESQTDETPGTDLSQDDTPQEPARDDARADEGPSQEDYDEGRFR